MSDQDGPTGQPQEAPQPEEASRPVKPMPVQAVGVAMRLAKDIIERLTGPHAGVSARPIQPGLLWRQITRRLGVITEPPGQRMGLHLPVQRAAEPFGQNLGTRPKFVWRARRQAVEPQEPSQSDFLTWPKLPPIRHTYGSAVPIPNPPEPAPGPVQFAESESWLAALQSAQGDGTDVDVADEGLSPVEPKAAGHAYEQAQEASRAEEAPGQGTAQEQAAQVAVEPPSFTPARRVRIEYTTEPIPPTAPQVAPTPPVPQHQPLSSPPTPLTRLAEPLAAPNIAFEINRDLTPATDLLSRSSRGEPEPATIVPVARPAQPPEQAPAPPALPAAGLFPPQNFSPADEKAPVPQQESTPQPKGPVAKLLERVRTLISRPEAAENAKEQAALPSLPSVSSMEQSNSAAATPVQTKRDIGVGSERPREREVVPPALINAGQQPGEPRPIGMALAPYQHQPGKPGRQQQEEKSGPTRQPPPIEQPPREPVESFAEQAAALPGVDRPDQPFAPVALSVPSASVTPQEPSRPQQTPADQPTVQSRAPEGETQPQAEPATAPLQREITQPAHIQLHSSAEPQRQARTTPQPQVKAEAEIEVEEQHAKPASVQRVADEPQTVAPVLHDETPAPQATATTPVVQAAAGAEPGRARVESDNRAALGPAQTQPRSLFESILLRLRGPARTGEQEPLASPPSAPAPLRRTFARPARSQPRQEEVEAELPPQDVAARLPIEQPPTPLPVPSREVSTKSVPGDEQPATPVLTSMPSAMPAVETMATESREATTAPGQASPPSRQEEVAQARSDAERASIAPEPIRRATEAALEPTDADVRPQIEPDWAAGSAPGEGAPLPMQEAEQPVSAATQAVPVPLPEQTESEGEQAWSALSDMAAGVAKAHAPLSASSLLNIMVHSPLLNRVATGPLLAGPAVSREAATTREGAQNAEAERVVSASSRSALPSQSTPPAPTPTTGAARSIAQTSLTDIVAARAQAPLTRLAEATQARASTTSKARSGSQGQPSVQREMAESASSPPTVTHPVSWMSPSLNTQLRASKVMSETVGSLEQDNFAIGSPAAEAAWNTQPGRAQTPNFEDLGTVSQPWAEHEGPTNEWATSALETFFGEANPAPAWGPPPTERSLTPPALAAPYRLSAIPRYQTESRPSRSERPASWDWNEGKDEEQASEAEVAEADEWAEVISSAAQGAEAAAMPALALASEEGNAATETTELTQKAQTSEREGGPELDELAESVYAIIRRRLEIERERHLV